MYCTIMTGRGRPRKAKSPDTKSGKTKTRPEEVKQERLPRSPRKQTQNGTTKEQKPNEQKSANHTETPSVQSIRKDFTEAPVQSTKAKTCADRTKTTEEEIKTQPETPNNTTKDSLKTTKAKTCGEKAKSLEPFSEEMTKMQRKTPKDTTKASIKTTKAKTCGGKAKAQEESAEGITKTHPQIPKDTTKDSTKTTKAKACAGKAKSLESFTEEKTKLHPDTCEDTTKASIKTKKAKTCAGKAKSQESFTEEKNNLHPETCEDTTKTCVPQDRRKDKATVDTLLHATLEKLKIKRNEKADAAEVINKIIQNIIMHLKQNTKCFTEVEPPLRTGSYYEYLKISNPDEFDVMLPIPVNRVDIKPFGDDGAFYSVALKRDRSPLQKFQEDSTLSASMMLKEFREEVKESVKYTEWEVTKKKKGCPAVTLITKLQSVTISLDVVLCLVVKSSWPPFTNDGLKIEKWLGRRVKQEHKRKPYYLVPKYEGRGTVENDGVPAKDSWRVSFSHIEKAILKNHGSEKTCCEKDGERCCRKDCLKLLKHLLSLLKEKDSSFDKFCSYHAKTTLLHACCSRNKDRDWMASNLSHCFQLLLQDFVDSLNARVLPNFFIPSQNLLSGCSSTRCDNLARCIREESDKGFPIFK